MNLLNINDKSVLRLNKNWSPIGVSSIKDALIALCGGNGDSAPALALDIQYNKDGEVENIIPTSFDEWIKLPIRDGLDKIIHTSKLRIRVPNVILSINYDKIPTRIRRLTSQAIWERDGFQCQYTGKKLTKKTGNVDHIIPKAKGGKDVWTNLVLADKNINSLKGEKYNYEIGLKLLRPPKEPLPSPCFTIDEIKHPDWKCFLFK